MEKKNEFAGCEYYVADSGDLVVNVKRGEKILMDDYVRELHTLDRSRYDTPGSIDVCACADCNRQRKSYGKRGRRWEPWQLQQHGVIESSGQRLTDVKSELQAACEAGMIDDLDEWLKSRGKYDSYLKTEE